MPGRPVSSRLSGFLGSKVLDQCVVACLQIQFLSSLCQVLKAMQEKNRSQRSRGVSIFLKSIVVIGFGQYVGDNASSSVLKEEYVALVQA